MTSKSAPRRNTLLIILDGFGVNPSKQNNAVYEANTPNLDHYFGSYMHTILQASGSAVGLPDGQMGNSEVGHTTIGCGTVVRQTLVRIDDAINDGSFAENAAIVGSIMRAKEMGRPLHLLGLVSDGGVHSHISHLCALIELCGRYGVTPMIHVITDGRDTAPKSAGRFLAVVEASLAEHGGRIATVSGRFYAMDRDQRWERTEQAWRTLVHREGDEYQSAIDAIESARSDEFVEPSIIRGGEPVMPGDEVFVFNFRSDRPKQIAAALSLMSFPGFDRGDFKPATVTTMTEYDSQLTGDIAYLTEQLDTNLSAVISAAGLRQLHTAETEKYAHVTSFFNGGEAQPYEGEERIMIESPKVATYDLCPEMSAAELADTVIEKLRQRDHSFIVVNFANGDMVGHTAIPDAVVAAVEVLDKEVGRVLDAAMDVEYSVVLTADHGNCDEYVDPITKEPNTQHTVYPVPCLVIDKSKWILSTSGGLGNIAPTVLQLMGLEKPPAMQCKSLLVSEVSA